MGELTPASTAITSIFEHDTRDVTVRDNIIMRGASFGAQVRGGGFIEDNVFLDNNAGVNFLGGRQSTATDNPIIPGTSRCLQTIW